MMSLNWLLIYYVFKKRFGFSKNKKNKSLNKDACSPLSREWEGGDMANIIFDWSIDAFTHRFFMRIMIK